MARTAAPSIHGTRVSSPTRRASGVPSNGGSKVVGLASRRRTAPAVPRHCGSGLGRRNGGEFLVRGPRSGAVHRSRPSVHE